MIRNGTFAMGSAQGTQRCELADCAKLMVEPPAADRDNRHLIGTRAYILPVLTTHIEGTSMSTAPSPREQFLVISAMGQQTTTLATSLTRLCMEQRCLIVSSRMSRHGTCTALLLQVSGNWDA